MKIPDKYLFILIPILVVMLTGIWFSSGMILGSGESGLPFHNFQILFPRTHYIWSDALIGSPTNPASFFFFGYMVVLSKFGIPNFMIQWSFYILIFSIGCLSIYFLTDDLFKDKRAAVMASLFYLLNLFTQMSIVNRLLYPFLYFYAFLPLGFLIYMRGMHVGRIRYAILFAITSIPFSLATASLPFLEGLWAVLLAYTIFSSAYINKKIVFNGIYFFTALIFWLLLNAWWFLPMLSSMFSTPYATAEAVTQSGNVAAFKVLSKMIGPVSQTLSLSDRSFLFAIAPRWGDFYLNPIGKTLSIIPSILALGCLVMQKKTKRLWFLLTLFVASVFFAKGSSTPLGEVSIALFSKIRFLEVFRNSFEKIGFILIFSMSPLVGMALSRLSKLERIPYLFPGLCALIFIVLPYPMWTGLVFGGDQVIVPKTYSQINNFLNSLSGQSRTLVLPLSGEGITYSWAKPYSGVELSSELISKPVISMTTSVPYLEDINSTLEESLSRKEGIFPDLLSRLNIERILVRNDVPFEVRQLRDPGDINVFLESDTAYSLESEFDGAKLYSVNRNTENTHIYGIYNTNSVYPESKFSDYLLMLPSSGEVSIDFDQNSDGLPNLIKPIGNFKIHNPKNVEPSEVVRTLPTVRHSPKSLMYPFIRMKEAIEGISISGELEPKLYFDLNILSKRIAEIYKFPSEAEMPVQEYLRHFKSNIYPLKNFIASRPVMAARIVDIALGHQLILGEVIKASSFEDSERLTSLRNYINKSMVELSLLPLHTPRFIMKNEARAIRFHVPSSGIYSLSLENDELVTYFSLPEKFEFQVDGIVKDLEKINYKGVTIDLGEFELTKGTHEVIIPIPEGKNLINSGKNMILNTNDGIIKIKVEPYLPGGSYLLDLKYLFNKGNSASIDFVQNIDYIDGDGVPSAIKSKINKDGYDHGWMNFSTKFKSSVRSSTAWLEVYVPPFNFCPSRDVPILDRCKDANYKKMFNKSGSVSIDKLSLTREFESDIFLTSTDSVRPELAIKVRYQKLDPTHYIVTIDEASKPFILVMSQLYHPGWKASQNSQELPHLRVDGYANGWRVDNTQGTEIILEYRPQLLMEASFYISLVFLFVSLLCLIY